MMMLTKQNRRNLPGLYKTEKTPAEDKIVQVKFFTPWSFWTWYAVEFDGEDTFFGYVVGFEGEWGYFNLSELKSIEGPFGLKVERDMYFTPKPFKEIFPDY